MDIVWKVLAGLVLLPFLIWGLSMVIQFMGFASVGIFAAFASVWDKKIELNFKHGLGMGFVYVILSLLISGLFWWFIGIHATAQSEIHQFIKGTYDLLGLGLLIIALVRLKFKFALGYFLSAIGITIFSGYLLMLIY